MENFNSRVRSFYHLRWGVDLDQSEQHTVDNTIESVIEYWLRSIGEGWHPIVKPLLEQLIVNGAEIQQVKEKFGGLRVYIYPHDEDNEILIRDAEYACTKRCETCGSRDRVQTRSPLDVNGHARGGWIKCLCHVHHAERDAKRPAPEVY